jgi:hypothetical protein
LCCDTSRFCVIKSLWVDGCGGHARIRTRVGQGCSERNGPSPSICRQASLETNDSTSLATIRISNGNLPCWTSFNYGLRVGFELEAIKACLPSHTDPHSHTPHRGAA